MKKHQPPASSLPFRLSQHTDFVGSILVPDHIVQGFNERVLRLSSKQSCWLYQWRPRISYDQDGRIKQPKQRDDYPEIRWRDPHGFLQTIPGHRLALLQDIGPKPLDGRYACHLCAVKLCLNPGHLYAGTPMQNAHDHMLMQEIQRRTGSTKGVVLPRHPVHGLRSRFVCEAFISDLIDEREQAKVDGPSRAGTSRRLSTEGGSLPSPRLRPARNERTAIAAV